MISRNGEQQVEFLNTRALAAIWTRSSPSVSPPSNHLTDRVDAMPFLSFEPGYSDLACLVTSKRARRIYEHHHKSKNQHANAVHAYIARLQG